MPWLPPTCVHGAAFSFRRWGSRRDLVFFHHGLSAFFFQPAVQAGDAKISGVLFGKFVGRILVGIGGGEDHFSAFRNHVFDGGFCASFIINIFGFDNFNAGDILLDGCHGFMHGPLSGTLMAEIILDGVATTVDVSALDLARFGEGRLIREFAVLLALGTPVRQLMGQLFVESAYIGLLGSLAGLVLGAACALEVQLRGLDMASLMPQGITVSGFAISTTIHARLTPPILYWTGGIVLASTLLLSLMPMRRIRRVRIAETLR
ncbi:MAG: FtsX-like permease family protein [Syntrophobacteraceae bacterium]|nr:FtsX-like permease family protein [Syntrophobacteraceae bacterium]